MKFFSRSEKSAPVFTPNGDRMIPDFQRKLQEDGTTRLEQVGSIDCYARIQACGHGLDVYSLIDTYRRTADPAVIDQQKGAYLDLTSQPATLAELEQFRIDSRNAFFALPLAVRNLFGNSFENFIRNPEKATEVLDSLAKAPRGITRKSDLGSDRPAHSDSPGKAESIPAGDRTGGEA